MLEKEKIRLLTENLQNEKIIAKNKQQRLLSEFRSFKKKSKYHFNPYFSLHNYCFIFVEEFNSILFTLFFFFFV